VAEPRRSSAVLHGKRSNMKILIVGENGHPHALAGALQTEGADVAVPPEGTLPAAGGDEVGQIAAALIAFEKLFTDEAPDAVLLVSASNLALAAVLVATKARIPVAGLKEGTPGDDRLSGMNRRLIGQLADATVIPDAGAIVAWLRSLVAV
jgi:UDP-N-acetylglucosamine 2-epimerase